MGYVTLNRSSQDAVYVGGVRASRNQSAATLALARTPFNETIVGGARRTGSRPAPPSVADTCRHSCKAALVEALIDCDVREIEQRFEVIAATPDSMAALKAQLHAVVQESGPSDAAVWAGISAAAARKPEVAAILARMEAGIASRIGVILGIVRSLPEADATSSFATHARAICLIAQDALNSRDRDDAPDAALTALVLCTIDWVLDDTLADLKDASP